MRRELQFLVRKYDIKTEERRFLRRIRILISEKEAPLCINCVYCSQKGFLFKCGLFHLPEDGKVVGNFGYVYYYRKGHKPKTYPNTPKNEKECEAYKPLVPRELWDRVKITEEGLKFLEKLSQL